VCVHDTQQVIKGMEFVFVEIPKFKAASTQDKRMTILWMRFMSEVGTEVEQNIDAELTSHPLIEQALKITEQASLTEAELEAYHAREDKARLDALYAIDARSEGKAELIKTLRANGMSLEQISLMTDSIFGLTSR
jgi:predicted transposase/invertase (TIGR01784 family)